MAEPKFEKDLEKLEEIVAALEEGDLPLDEALKRFEEGIKLAKRCEKALCEAEKRIELLTKNADGQLEAQPFVEEQTKSGSGGPVIRKERKIEVTETETQTEEGEMLF